MEQWLLKTIEQLYRDGGKTPVKTIILAGMLDKDDGQIRGVLRRMEAAKLIVRKGQRMGWMPARASQSSVDFVIEK
jgi:predicted transcriptional regulator